VKILNFGSINKDFVYLVENFVQSGQTISSKKYEVFLGGKGLNQSVALAHSGANIYHAGCINKNDDSIIIQLNKWGVNTDNIIKVEDPTGHAIIQVNDNGENSIIIHGGANHSISSEQIENTLNKFKSGDILVLQNEINKIEEIINRGYEIGMKIFLNPAPFTKEIINYPLQKLDTLIFNESEGFGLSSGEQDKTKILKYLSKKYPSTKLLLTLGKKGSIYIYNNKVIEIPANKVNSVDTTAAGDTYIGYFISSYYKNNEVKESMEIASKAASISTTKMGGAISIPKL
tara:strand:- start:10463 stop:11326 length:864 start_codon:yes stop_codon:yes gene_type:complete